MHGRLEVRLGPLTLKNPVMPAAGCFNSGGELAQAFDPGRLGAVINKTVMPRPHPGNPPPRLAETPSGLINAIGIPSDGPEAFVREQLPILRAAQTTRIVSIGGFSPADFAELAGRLAEEAGIDAFELDLSCPNHNGRGLFALYPEATREVLRQTSRQAKGIPLIAKLAPVVTDITEIARAALEAGAVAVTVANTYPAMVIDVDRGLPVLGNTTGGLSGPAIRPITLRLVWELGQALPELPVIAAGGIETAADALQYLLAGARAVQVGTALFYDPLALLRILEGLEAFLERRGIDRIEDLVGAARRGGLRTALSREGSLQPGT